jgi:hypothetical protein
VRRLVSSLVLVLIMITFVAFVVGSIFFFQYWSMHEGRDCTFAVGDVSDNCKEGKQTSMGPYVAQGLNSLSITVMNVLFSKVAATVTVTVTVTVIVTSTRPL